MKKFSLRLGSAAIIATMMLSSVSAYAAQSPESISMNGTELPNSIMMDGREFVMDVNAGGGSGTAMPDKSMTMMRSMARSSYKVTGSDVRLYVDYSHGHGGDHFAAGWVEATAPRFTARAEVWANGKLDTTGSNNLNKGNIANAASYLACGIVKNATPRIFYNW